MRIARTVVLPLEGQPALQETLDEALEAYAIISEFAHEQGIISRFRLQKHLYETVRTRTKLTAQMTCSAFRKIAAAYAAAKSNGHEMDTPFVFAKRSLELEGGSRGRDFKLCSDEGIVSISTVRGRKKVHYQVGRFQKRYLDDPAWRVQAARLVQKRRKKGWRYELHVSLIKDVAPVGEGHDGVLGVDTGRRYLATATTGDDAAFFKAGHTKSRKEHYRRIRSSLKSKGTRSCERVLKRLSGRERRFTKDFQHVTAKKLVELALEKRCGIIAVERLKGIKGRTAARGKKARYHHGTWAYGRFLDILRYKAEGAGLEVFEVEPTDTSRACSRCGHVDKANREGLSFSCSGCGYALHADLNAARNIRLRAIAVGHDLDGDGRTSCVPEVGLAEAETSRKRRTEAESTGKPQL